MKLAHQYMAFFFNFSLKSNHLHPLQVENCDSNSRLVVDEDDNGKFRLERANRYLAMTARARSTDRPGGGQISLPCTPTGSTETILFCIPGI